MDKLVIVVGHCCNEIYIPITAYKSLDTARAEITKILGIPPHIDYDEQLPTGSDKQFRQCKWRTLGDSQEMQDKIATMFTSYYDGCGSVDQIIAIEVYEGELIFPFSLD